MNEETTVEFDHDVTDSQDLSLLAYEEIADGVLEVTDLTRLGEFDDTVRITGSLTITLSGKGDM